MQVISTQNKLDILLVEDSRGDALLVEKALNAALPGAFSLTTVVTLEDALNILSERVFDIALLDRSLPDVDGFNGLHSLQNIAPHLPIVFLTAYKDEETAFAAIEQGAQDYLFKDKIDGHVIKRAVQYAMLRKQFEAVLILRANFDMLTGLVNRILFESRLDMAIARAKRHNQNMAVMLLDLNEFKPVNDRYGHSVGDELLVQVAQRLKATLRESDTVARFGGDEFSILLENMDQQNDCLEIAKKLVQLFEVPFELSKHTVKVGISVGIAMSRGGCWAIADRDEIIKQADSAMYRAKRANGDHVEVFRADEEGLLESRG